MFNFETHLHLPFERKEKYTKESKVCMFNHYEYNSNTAMNEFLNRDIKIPYLIENIGFK